MITFFLFFTSFLFAVDTKEIVVATESWHGATNRDGTGLYWDIVEEIYAPLGYKIVKKHTSYSKATEMVQYKNADLWLGSYKDEKKFAQYPKYYFDQDVITALFSTDNIEEWEGQETLEGLKVGWIRGYDFDKYLSFDVIKEEINERISAFKLLKGSRIDVYLEDKKDLDRGIEKYRFPMEDFVKKVIMQLKIYPAFAKTKKGQILLKQWDKRMAKLIKTRKFQEIYFNSGYTLFPY